MVGNHYRARARRDKHKVLLFIIGHYAQRSRNRDCVEKRKETEVRDLIWFVLFVLTLCLFGFNVDRTKKENIKLEFEKSEIISRIESEILYRDSIIKTWEDHAIRMKRIMGVSDTSGTWSYKNKVLNPL